MIRRDYNTSLKQFTVHLLACDSCRQSMFLMTDMGYCQNIFSNWITLNELSVSLLNISVCVLLCSLMTARSAAISTDSSWEIYWYDSPGSQSECWGRNSMCERFKERRVIQNMKKVKKETRLEMSLFISVHQVHFQCSRMSFFFFLNIQLLKLWYSACGNETSIVIVIVTIQL